MAGNETAQTAVELKRQCAQMDVSGIRLCSASTSFGFTGTRRNRFVYESAQASAWVVEAHKTQNASSPKVEHNSRSSLPSIGKLRHRNCSTSYRINNF
jgi:hypothetical protein